MVRKLTTARNRRDFLKRSGALAALGFTTSLTPDLAFGQARTDLNGVTIDYWNMIGVQNKIVRQISEDVVNAFQQKTGCKVNVTWNGYGDIIGPKYRTNFTGGIMPTVMDTSSRWVNQLREFLYPLNDYVENAWEPEVRVGVEWLFPLNEEENQGFPDKDQLYGLPFNLVMQAPYIMRRDHLEEAGLSFDENYPIRDTDHFLEICNVIKDKLGVPYPTEVYGKIWDFGDTQLNGWIRSLSIEDSDFLNADWTKSNARSEAWKQGCQFYVDVFRKHELSSPNSPQSTDEDTVDQFILGRKSIVHCDILNRGTLLDRMPEQVADGTVVWGPHFPITGGTSGSQCFLGPNSFYIVKQEGADADIKQQAAWEFIKEWFLPENMIAVAKSSGLCARRDLWDQLKGEPDRSVEASIETIGDNPGMWTGHRRSVDFQYNLLAPHGQRMLQGEPVDQELNAYADEVDKALQQG
jgi:multiple sugar transport system substrate-binding protein